VLESASEKTEGLVGTPLDRVDVQDLAGGIPGGMSGICAVWGKEDPARVIDTLVSVSRGLARERPEHVDRKTALEAGVAVSAAFPTQQAYDNGRLLIACDADLCNEDELRTLTGEKSANPAVLIAALYDRFGSGFPRQLNGNFSIVLWDCRQRKLLAAVDRFGVKRLVYFQNGKMLLIASRIDALMRTGEIAAGINPRAIAHFMNFGVSLAPETIITGIQRLAPGTVLLASVANTQVSEYWDMRYGLGDNSNEARLSRELESVVQQAVARNCRGDSLKQTGAYLSGGTDSSTVVGMMARLDRGPVKAFSIGFDDERFNELGYAEISAKKFQAEHHTYRVTANDCFAALPRMVWMFDEPFGNSSAIPTYFCARLAAENGVTTLLAGDGGDELFGGNERYLTDKLFSLYQTVPRALRKGALEPILNSMPFENGLAGKARRYVRRSNLPAIDRFFSYNLLCAHPPTEIFEGDFLRELAGYSVLELPTQYFNKGAGRHHLDRLLYVDVKITLGDSDLPKVTQMSELAGIQTRFPFLDAEIADFSGRIPARLKVKGFDKRYLFKRAFRDLLPAEVIQKKKHGFGIPVSTWLKSDSQLREFSRDILFSKRALGRGYFRREFLDDLVRLHDSDNSSYYGDNLWSFLVLELWHRQFVDQLIETAVWR
jgi:asparagine synthase (glutamine-hydrolysing)